MKKALLALLSLLLILSLLCAVADICMEYVVNPLPLSPAAVALGTFISFSYKLLRNTGLVIYLLFLFTITKTDYRIGAVLNGLLMLWLIFPSMKHWSVS